MMKLCAHCGKPVAKPRSPDDHRRFFGLIAAAFHHWPEDHEFQPDTAEHLRAWLLIKAGYRTVTPIECEWLDNQTALARLVALAIEGALRAQKGYSFVRVHGDRIAVFAARSIDWETLDQKAFAPVREAVEGVIKAETGLDPDQLLSESEKPA